MKIYINELDGDTKKFYGNIEYSMPQRMAKEIIRLGSRTVDPQVLLCEYVNMHLGIKGNCTRVVVTRDGSDD